MKKTAALLLSILLLLTAGCDSEPAGITGSFYYRRAVTEFGVTDGIVTSEKREIPGPLTDTGALLDSYFSGPEDNGLISPFPRDSAAVNWEIRDQTLILTMNDSFGALTDVELSIACACICRTFTALLPVTEVQIQLEDSLIGGQKSIVLSEDDIRLYDNGLDQSRTEFTVYYTDNQRRYLIADKVSVNLATEDDVVSYLVEALMTPPENSGLYTAIPRHTELLSYSVDDGICTINFSSEFERNSWTGCEAQRLTLLSVVNTLTQLEGIQQVEFASEGSLLISYENLAISDPFVFDENAIGPVRTGVNEFDATLYLSNGTGDALAAVPTRVRQNSGISQAELVVEALLNYEPSNSLFTQIPEGTAIRSVTVRNGTCLVDLSREFLSSDAHLLRSVRSIVASLCSLNGINSVQITVEGQTPEGDYGQLFGVLFPQSNWYL